MAEEINDQNEIKKRRMDLVVGITFEKYKILPLMSSVLVALLALSFANNPDFIKNLGLFKIAIAIFLGLIPLSLFFFLRSFKFEEEDMISKFKKIQSGNTQNSDSAKGWKWVVLNSPKIMLSILALGIALIILSIFIKNPQLKFTTMTKDKISSLISLGVALTVLIASYFQWWSISYDGKMLTKLWVKILFSILIIAVLMAAYLVSFA